MFESILRKITINASDFLDVGQCLSILRVVGYWLHTRKITLTSVPYIYWHICQWGQVKRLNTEISCSHINNKCRMIDKAFKDGCTTKGNTEA